MTDEEWLQVLEKKVSSFEVLHFPGPLHAYGRVKERMHICYYEMFIIGRNLTIFSCVALIFHAAEDTNSNFANPRLKCAKWRDIR